MSLKIVRNDITKMNTEAIVNTANQQPIYGDGVDSAVYKAAGEQKLLAVRKEIGEMEEGEVFITPGFDLPAKYIIHAVSPVYINGELGEEEKLRGCYRKSLILACEKGIKSISFPLISTGSFGYPMADGFRIALDECNAFLLDHDIDISLVVFGTRPTLMAEKIFPKLEAYIDHNYVCQKREEEYGDAHYGSVREGSPDYDAYQREYRELDRRLGVNKNHADKEEVLYESHACSSMDFYEKDDEEDYDEYDNLENFPGESELEKRMQHLTDPFGRYLMYLIEEKGKTSKQVQDNAWITRKVYSKINTHQDTYHPDKRTACQLCVGLGLNLDETKDLIRRAGYDFSPSDGEDMIWSFFFGMDPHEYDIFDINDALVKYGYKPIVVLKMNSEK